MRISLVTWPYSNILKVYQLPRWWPKMGEQNPARWTKRLGDEVSVILQREFTAYIVSDAQWLEDEIICVFFVVYVRYIHVTWVIMIDNSVW